MHGTRWWSEHSADKTSGNMKHQSVAEALLITLCAESVITALLMTWCTEGPMVCPGIMAGTQDCLLFAVCGLHMRDQALCHQLVDLGATFQETTKTASTYRLFVLPHPGGLTKPGLVRSASGGGSIDIETWQLPLATVGPFLKNIPSPLAVGSILLEDQTYVLGFICESFVLNQPDSPQEITHLGGFLPFLKQQQPQQQH